MGGSVYYISSFELADGSYYRDTNYDWPLSTDIPLRVIEHPFLFSEKHKDSWRLSRAGDGASEYYKNASLSQIVTNLVLNPSSKPPADRL